MKRYELKNKLNKNIFYISENSKIKYEEGLLENKDKPIKISTLKNETEVIIPSEWIVKYLDTINDSTNYSPSYNMSELINRYKNFKWHKDKATKEIITTGMQYCVDVGALKIRNGNLIYMEDKLIHINIGKQIEQEIEKLYKQEIDFKNVTSKFKQKHEL